MIHVTLAAFGARAGDRRGYRWLWAAPELGSTFLSECYARLETAKLSEPGHLHRLQEGEWDAGLLTLDWERCAAYRFIHGGRDGTREKSHLTVAVIPRQDLSRLNLKKLLSHPCFLTVSEESPEQSSLSLEEYSCAGESADPVERTFKECLALTRKQGFHLQISGPAEAPVARWKLGPALLSPTPPPAPLSASLALSPDPARPESHSPTTEREVAPPISLAAVFGVGVVVGFLLATLLCVLVFVFVIRPDPLREGGPRSTPPAPERFSPGPDGVAPDDTNSTAGRIQERKQR